ncbi:MAG: hypothetical protein ACE5GB_13865 [Acidimicrobiales bacterium]
MSGEQRKKRSKRSRRGRAKPAASAATARTAGDFWGDVELLPTVDDVRVSTDPSAVVRSLGRPPLTGHEAISEHYLRAVYEQTATLAQVLATAGDLLGEDDD